MAFHVDFLASYDIESLTEELRRIAAVSGKKNVSSADIIRFGRVNVTTIYHKFGTISHANEAAGLEFQHLKRFTNHEVLRILLDLWKKTFQESGRRPLQSDLKKYGVPFSSQVVTRRFGTWRSALLAANNLPEHDVAQPAIVVRRRSGISVHRRFQVFKRDGYGCQMCHRTDVPLEVDHIIPVCHGGSSELDNLQTLCSDCNRGKGGNRQ